MINLETEILWSLRIEDLEIAYDNRKSAGAYAALTPIAKKELIRLVKRGLENGIYDYMNEAVNKALMILSQDQRRLRAKNRLGSLL